MYVAVKGGERAIQNAHAWLAEERRGDKTIAELNIAQIRETTQPCRQSRHGGRALCMIPTLQHLL